MRTTVVFAIALALTALSSAPEARHAAPALAGAIGQQAATAAQSGASPKPAPVDLNTATQKELETLPGVGPAMAARIIEYRVKEGGFKKIEDLMNVRGIGEKVFLKLKPMIVVTRGKGLE